MSALEDQHLTRPTAALALANPRLWDEFIAAFKLYSDARRNELVQAAPDQLKKAQGRAQACASLVPLLEGAVQAANNINARDAAKTKKL